MMERLIAWPMLVAEKILCAALFCAACVKILADWIIGEARAWWRA